MTTKDFYLSEAWLREIGAMLKDARLSRGMTQKEIAEIAGVYQPYITRIESGDYDLKVSTLGRLCSALGMTIDIKPPKGYSDKTEKTTRLIADKEYSVAIDRQYSDIENRKSESSCRQALGSLRKQQYVMIDGKQRNATLIESDEIVAKLEKLKADITAAISISR